LRSESLIDLIIIGGGPAGLTAAIYSSRMGVKTLLIERSVLGGRAVEAPIIENFPGFPDGITGTELIERMRKQVERFGTDIKAFEEVVNLELQGRVKKVTTKTGEYRSLSLIVATGTHHRKLLVPGETEFLGRGVSYCVVCDGPLFRGRVNAVIGSGDEAFEDALYLSNFSRKVILITGREEIEAAEDLVGKFREKENAEIFEAKVERIHGDEIVKSIVISRFEDERSIEIPVDGVFISLGGVPMTNLVRKAGIAVDKRGCIKVDRRQSTNIEGVFAAGDCTC